MGIYGIDRFKDDEDLDDEDLDDEDLDDEDLDDEDDNRIPEGTECEYCERPATYVTPDGLYLCEDHYDDYVDGWTRED